MNKPSFDMGGFRSRRRKSGVAMALCLAATVVGLACLALVLGTLLIKGMAGLSLKVFTEMTPPPGADGGLLNPIIGSLIMTTLGVLIGTPIGILAGTYMAEYGRHARISQVIRFINDILLSAPSIVIGLFVYTLVVAPMGHFSGLAGAIALAILVIPVVIRTTEDASPGAGSAARGSSLRRHAAGRHDPQRRLSCGAGRDFDGSVARDRAH
jgi:phosphate transport system permease protein